MDTIRTLNFTVVGQRIAQSGAQLELPPVSDSVNYLFAHFDCSPEWEPLSKLAVFESERGGRFTVALEDFTCKIPAELLCDGGARLEVGLLGFGDGAYRLTTDTAAVTVESACATSGETPAEPTPELYASLAESIRKSKSDTDTTLAAHAAQLTLSDSRLDTALGALEALETRVDSKLDSTLEAKYAGRVVGIAANGELVPVEPARAANGRFANALTARASGTSLTLSDVSPIEHELDVTLTGSNSRTAKLTVSGKTLLEPDKVSPLNNVYSARGLTAHGALRLTGLVQTKSNESGYITSKANAGVYSNNALQLAFKPLGRPIMEYPFIKIGYRTDSLSDIIDCSMRAQNGESWLLSMPEAYSDMNLHEFIINLNTMYGGAGVPAADDTAASLIIKPFGSSTVTLSREKHFDIKYIAGFSTYEEAAAYSFEADPTEYAADFGLILAYNKNAGIVGIGGNYSGAGGTLSLPLLKAAQSELAGAGYPIYFTTAEDPAGHLSCLEGPDSEGIIRAVLTGVNPGEQLAVRFRPVIYQSAPAEYLPDASGRVVGVKSLAPEMKLSADRVVTINAVYERDANAVIDALEARIAALEAEA